MNVGRRPNIPIGMIRRTSWRDSGDSGDLAQHVGALASCETFDENPAVALAHRQARCSIGMSRAPAKRAITRPGTAERGNKADEGGRWSMGSQLHGTPPCTPTALPLPFLSVSLSSIYGLGGYTIALCQ